MPQNYRIKIVGRKFSAGQTVLATRSIKEVLLQRMFPLKLTIPRSEGEENLLFWKKIFLNIIQLDRENVCDRLYIFRVQKARHLSLEDWEHQRQGGSRHSGNKIEAQEQQGQLQSTLSSFLYLKKRHDALLRRYCWVQPTAKCSSCLTHHLPFIYISQQGAHQRDPRLGSATTPRLTVSTQKFQGDVLGSRTTVS